jgi:thioredoxin-related protein
MKADDFLGVLHYFGDGHYKKQSFQEYQDQMEAAAPHKEAP